MRPRCARCCASNPVYAEHLPGWRTEQHETVGGSNRGSVPRTEVVWLNW